MLILTPAKEETLYLNPYIVMYHDCILDREIAMIKSLAFPKVSHIYINPNTSFDMIVLNI